MYYEMFRLYCDLKCYEIFMFLIFFTIALCLVPVVGVLAILAYIGFGLYGGINCAIEGYKYNIGRGIVSIMFIIHVVDVFSNKLIFDSKKSCFPACEDTCKTKKDKKPKKKKENKNDSQNKEESDEEKNLPNSEKDPKEERL